MADSGDLLDGVVEVAHQFEIDLTTLVVLNHQLTVDGIATLEQREIAQTKEDLAGEDPEVLDSQVRFQEWFYSDLRIDARNLALVGLITRFQHWIEKFTQELGVKPRQADESTLVSNLKEFETSLGARPHPCGLLWRSGHGQRLCDSRR
jgi:hypothetical protein